MNWSFAAIFLALLFTTACSQRGGRRYLPDQPLEESLAVDNHRFQTRSRVDVEDARRGEGRRARIQETTETNARLNKGRSRTNTEEPRQFHSRKEQESKPSENRQFASRRSLETDPTRQSSRDGARNERFRSRESSTTIDGALKVKNTRGRTRVESTTVEYKSRGTETKRFPSRGTQEREASRSSKDLDHLNVGERPESRRRTQTTRKNAIEPPKNTEPVTEGFISRQPLRDEIQRSGVKETTEKNVQNHHNIPITEGKVPDLTSASNEIEIEKRTRPLDSSGTVTEKLHPRREGIRRSRIDLSTENINLSQRNGRRKSEELQTRGSGLESRRRSRPTDISVTERFHSRQLSRDEYPSKRSRVNSSTEKIRNDNGNAHTVRGRKGHEYTSRGSGAGFEKRRPTETSIERFRLRESEREKSQNRIEPSTSASIETEVSPELSNKEINSVDAENKIQTENIAGEPTAEANIDAAKPITSQPDPLSTENTVDFPIKSNDVEEPNRTSRKLEADIPERINQNQHRGQNHDFENSKRGRLESTLSRDKSRPQEAPSRGTEGRRSSRRFGTQSPDASKETIKESKGRTYQRLPSRSRNADIPSERGRQKLDGGERNTSVRHRSESQLARSRNVERIPQTAITMEPVTESRLENKVSTIETQIQNEQKNEVTLAEPAETQVASTQKALPRNVNHKSGNRGRGNMKGTNTQEEKEHSGEVKDEDNYPEVYKQLKKSGTDPKDILALLKARKAVKEKLEKTNSKISQPETSLNSRQRPVFGSDEIKTPQLSGTTEPSSNFRSRYHKSGELNQRIESKIVKNEEPRNLVGSTEKTDRFSNFRSSRYKTSKTFNQKSELSTTVKTTNELITEEKLLQDEAPKEKKYNPYNYQEIRSFNRKKNSNFPERSKNYRNTVKTFKNSDEHKLEEKNGNDEFHLSENQEPVEEKIKKSFIGPGTTSFRSILKNNNNPSLKREEINSQNNGIDEIINEETPRNERTKIFTGPGVGRLRSSTRSNSHETENNEDGEKIKQNDGLNDTIEDEKLGKERKLSREEEKESITQSSIAKETSDRGRKFGLTAPDNNKFRNKFNTRSREKSESDLAKSLRQTSFTNPGISKFKSRKENDVETSSPEINTEKTKTRSYIPRNRESDIKKFKARTEKTLEDVSIEPSINRNYNLFNRNEHSFRRRSFTSPASEGTEMLTTTEYKNSMVAARTRPPFVPQRKKFVKTTTLDPLPLSRFKARKASLSKSFNEEVLKVDNSEDHTLTFNFKEEDDMRPNIDDLSIDSLVSESEHLSLTTETSTISSARKRPKYTESHIQRVPPKRRGSEYFKLATTSSTTSKAEVYTVLAVPYYDESTSAPETTISSESVLDPTTQSTTLSDIIPTTTPISTTDITSTSFSTTETSSTTTVTTTETSQSTTSSLFTSEMSTEPSTIKTTTDSIVTKSTTEPLTSTTELISTIPTTTTQLPTTITTTTTTTTKRPTTTTTTTKRPTTKTTTKRPTTKTTTKRPTTTTITTKRPTTTQTTTKRPTTTQTTTKRPTTTTKKPTKSTTSSTTKLTTRKTTAVNTTKPTTKKPAVNSTKMPTTRKTTPKPTARTTTIKSTEKPSTTVTTHSTPLSTQKAAHLTTTFKIDELLSTNHPNFLSTIAYLARNLTVTPSLYENANTANFKTPSIPTENTTPMQNQSAMKNDYFVYGLLPNNNVVRKVVKTTASPMDVPFYIYGLYPNGTIVRRFPNGTVVPDEIEENEVIGKIEPGSGESLETVVKKDNPLSYLYPPGHEKITTQTVYSSSTTTIKQPESSPEVIPIDPRIAPKSSLEKPAVSIKDIASNSSPTTVKSTTKWTTAKSPTKSTTIKSTTKLTSTNPPTKSATTKPTTKLTTIKPSTKAPVTKAANIKMTTAKSTTKITTTKPATTKPTAKPTTAKPIAKTTTRKPTTKTTSKPTLRPTTTKPPLKASVTKSTSKSAANKPSMKSSGTTIKPSSTATTKSTTKTTPKTKVTTKMPVTTTNKLIKSTSKTPPKAATTKPNRKNQEKSTIKTITTPLSDAELLNNLLSQDVKEIIPKGTTESTVALADKVIQLAIERAQKSSTAPSVLSPEDLQSLSSTSAPVQKQSLGGKHNETPNNLGDESNTNKTGKISVWVIPPDESTTSKPSIGVSKSEAELLNALLSSPSTIENLSLSDQLLLADIISSTAAPPTTRKKKKKSRTTTTTTTPPPPAFPILQYLFGRNRGGGGGLFQRGLFRGGGLRNLESGTTPINDGGIFQNDGLPQGQGELAAESQEDPQQGEGGPGLVSAAINVSRAVSQFMGYVIQGAAQSFQNYLQTRTRALASALTYPPAS